MIRTLVLTAFVLLISVDSARAQSFIIEPAATLGAVPDAIYTPGGIGGFPPPAILVPGLLVPLGVDAISYDRPLSDMALAHAFSVSPGSLGAAGTAVATQSAFFEQAADIYVSAGLGGNALLFDGNGIAAPTGATAGPLGLIEGPAGDNLNALDLRVVSPSGLIYFSVDPFTAGAAYGGPPLGSAANIYIAPFVPLAPGYDAPVPVPTIYASFLLLGLAPLDNIDALVVFEDGLPGFGPLDVVRFSLAPGSPSLPLLGAGAADIIDVAGPFAIPTVVATAASLGLLPGANIDALDVVVPEPSTLALLAFGGLTAAAGRARRYKKTQSKRCG